MKQISIGVVALLASCLAAAAQVSSNVNVTNTTPWAVTGSTGTFPTTAAAAAYVDGWDATQGAKADAACSTDTGTCSLIALIKRNNQNVASTATVAIADGGDVTQGAKADAICASAVGTCTEISLLKFIATSISGPIPTQASTIPIGGTTPLAGASGGATPTFAIAPTTPAGVNIKNTAGTLYGAQLASIQATPAYIKFYDSATAPTCGSGTPVAVFIIPAASTAANGGGSNISLPVGKNFANGIGYCITGGLPNADTTALTAASVLVNIDWK